MNMIDRHHAGVLRAVTKPGRYTGGEFHQIIKDREKVKCRFAFAFPDVYEIGMSNLGVRILYHCLNAEPDIWCERAYTPWPDMQEKMHAYGLPMAAHESGDPLRNFDIVGFTLQYELCYTNVLATMKLAGIPLFAKDRGEGEPIIIGGGPCAYNAEPVADFFDVFSIGEGEEALPEFCRLYIKMKEAGTYTKADFLHEVAKLPGFYVPSLYEVSYHEDGRIAGFSPKYGDVPMKITKRIVKDLDQAPYPDKPVLPYIETVHDRIMLEVYRGCIHGCRFCQAGMTNRPVREKSPAVLDKNARCLFENTGYDEMSLISLSISDYSRLDELTDRLLSWTNDAKVALTLPSLRVDSFTEELMEKISTVRTGGLTFAPEAGTQRLRDAINKNVEEADLLRAVDIAFSAGKSSVKLYFMMGLPTEELSDLDGIAELADKVVSTFYKNPKRNRMKGITVTISVACFIPKPFTPFQWEAQDDMETLEMKQKYLREKITNRRVKYNYHDARVSRLEAVFARGDRRLAPALALAAEEGVMFDSWDEYFDYEKWMDIFARAGVDPAFYANRRFEEDEILPWDLIDCGVSRAFLLREKRRAYESKTTPNCAEHCSGCGANCFGGEPRWCK